MKGKVYIKHVGWITVELAQIENRKTFVFFHESRYYSPRLHLVKEVIYRDCLGIRRKILMSVYSKLIFLTSDSFNVKTYQTQLLNEYEESRRENRLYLKNLKKIIDVR